MPAIVKELRVEAGSFEPQYWTFTNPATGAPLDLTQSGYVVTGAVNAEQDGTGTVLLSLPDNSVWRRTATGRVYFQPHSVTSSTWTFPRGFYQVELAHPSGETVRFGEGPFLVSPELVTP